MAAGTWRSANKAPVDCNHCIIFSSHPATVHVPAEIMTIVYTRLNKMLKYLDVQTNKIIYYTNLPREYTILIFFSSSQIVHQSLMQEESSPLLSEMMAVLPCCKNDKTSSKIFLIWHKRRLSHTITKRTCSARLFIKRTDEE